MSDTDNSPRPSFLDRQRDAALAQITEQQQEFRRVAELVIPSDRRRRSDERVTDVIRLGNDHLVEVTKRGSDEQGDTVRWTFVIGDKAAGWYHHTQEDAILHLIASRYDDNPNSNGAAALYAGRVLGIPAE
ncbi:MULTISPECIES: hypothetical protein [unclassified Micromonospora]|uniref:hypothetical protein n=1 Tax=unclassified Micromonospora TaxID=2617518 RepID=UPI0033246CD8